jgi:hypothetical protein
MQPATAAQVREKELGSRVRRAAPRRPRDAVGQRAASSRGRLAREDASAEEVRARKQPTRLAAVRHAPPASP